MESTKLLLSITDAASRLDLGRSHFYLLLQAGRVQSVKVGRRRLIPVASLEAFVATQIELAKEAEGGS